MATIRHGNKYTINIQRDELSNLIRSGKWSAYKLDLLARRNNGQVIKINRI